MHMATIPECSVGQFWGFMHTQIEGGGQSLVSSNIIVQREELSYM